MAWFVPAINDFADFSTERRGWPARADHDDGVDDDARSSGPRPEQELKAARALDVHHWAQCLNYPNATGLPFCLLLNFGGPRLEIKRIVLDLQASASFACFAVSFSFRSARLCYAEPWQI